MNLYKQALLGRVARYYAPMGDHGADGGGGTAPDTDDADDAALAALKSAHDPGPDVDPENPDADPQDNPLKSGDPEKNLEDTLEDPKGKKGVIPLDRHKAVLNKERETRRALEAELAKYQNGAQVADINKQLTAAEEKILSLDRQYATLMADGEVTKAAELMAEIRRQERSLAETRAELRSNASTARAVEQTRYEIALERVAEAYPQLDDDSDEYDADLAQDVADMKAVYMGRGDTPTAALQKAVKRLLGTDTSAQRRVVSTTPRVDTKAIAEKTGVPRKQEAVQKAVDAMRRQPPSAASVGMDSDRAGGGLTAKDVAKMTDEELEKLPLSVLQRLRGDMLA